MDVIDRIGPNWPIVSSLLDRALELAPAEREYWIANLSPEHAAFAPELAALLHQRSISGVLEQAPSAAIPLPDPAIEPAGTVGIWELLRPIGEGGMATVWLARRSDGLLSQPVAIKLPQGGWSREALSERIEREREILGRLNHPNIARLLDAGFTPAGQPYLALDYIEGSAIDEYCRCHVPSIRGRVELFLQLTRAIAYAHQHLVLHRDLKPSNVLVTNRGEVRVLDFGIAKLLDCGSTRETELTRVAGRALTLDYASPEQIRGEPLTVASDVYSLGVMLYQLLAGAPPYHLKRDSRAALEEAILELEPRPPSEAAGTTTLRRALRGDCDTIVLKALKKDPSARYATVDGLAEDLTRLLDNRPVQARPDGTLYRMSKFVRRNRTAVAAGVALAVSLIGGTGAALWQANVAKAEAARAREAKEFLLSVFIDAHAYRSTGRPLSALDLLREAPTRIDRMRSLKPEVRVELLNNIGASLLSRQDTAVAETVLNRSVMEAAPLDPGHVKTLRARSLRGWVRLFRGRTGDALSESAAVLSGLRHAPGAGPADFTSALRLQSAAALESGNAPLAESDALQAFRLAETRLGPRHDQTVLAQVALCSARTVTKGAGALDTCEQARRRALAAYSGQTNHPNVLKARAAWAEALASAGRRREAIEETERVVADASALFGSSARAVGIYLSDLARLRSHSGRTTEARETLDRALRILSGHMDPDSEAHAALLERLHSIDTPKQRSARADPPRPPHGPA